MRSSKNSFPLKFFTHEFFFEDSVWELFVSYLYTPYLCVCVCVFPHSKQFVKIIIGKTASVVGGNKLKHSVTSRVMQR